LGGLNGPVPEAESPASQHEALRRARRYLERWRGLKDRLQIARRLGEVFADSGFDAATQFEDLGDRKLANLWKLLDLARTFERSGLFGLAEFIARLGNLVKTQPREERAATQPEIADVVRLMTIHQAKGLEFPVVFVADLVAAGGGSARPIAEWDRRLGCVARPPADEEEPPFPDFGYRLWRANEELEQWREDLRTLYVACTRPQDYLVLSAALAEDHRPAGPWMLTLAERFGLDTGACLPPDIPPSAGRRSACYANRTPGLCRGRRSRLRCRRPPLWQTRFGACRLRLVACGR
jgi:ATP-dependent helicase/nuclease subunit A